MGGILSNVMENNSNNLTNNTNNSSVPNIVSPYPRDPRDSAPLSTTSSTHSGTAASSNMNGPRLVYNVKFKRTQRSFILGPRAPRDVKIGCYVKVEADRGEDLGFVVSRMPAEKYNSAGRSNYRNAMNNNNNGNNNNSSSDPLLGGGGANPNNNNTNNNGAADLKQVIRLATHDEVNHLKVKKEEEDELLKICRTKVKSRDLPMTVCDAEYQFDRNKLTFFFEAEGRIDFRELVRDLFSIYKTRIWMQQLDKNNNSVGTGTGVSASTSTNRGGGGMGVTVSDNVTGTGASGDSLSFSNHTTNTATTSNNANANANANTMGRDS